MSKMESPMVHGHRAENSICITKPSNNSNLPPTYREATQVTCKNLNEVDLLEVWQLLGGQELRQGRGKAFWRDGNGYNIALDTKHGRWYDHAMGVGGGTVSLVSVVLGTDRRGAFSWFESEGFIEPRRRLSPVEKQIYAQRRRLAQDEALQALGWREQRLFELDLAKQRANAADDLKALEPAARLEFLISTANARELMELFRQDRDNNPKSFMLTMAEAQRIAAAEKELMLALEEVLKSDSSYLGEA